MNYMTFKENNNITFVLTQIYYNSDNECIGCSFTLLYQTIYCREPYNLKDENEFNIVKRYLINSIINNKLFYQDIDMSTISYNQTL